MNIALYVNYPRVDGTSYRNMVCATYHTPGGGFAYHAFTDNRQRGDRRFYDWRKESATHGLDCPAPVDIEVVEWLLGRGVHDFYAFDRGRSTLWLTATARLLEADVEQFTSGEVRNRVLLPSWRWTSFPDCAETNRVVTGPDGFRLEIPYIPESYTLDLTGKDEPPWAIATSGS